MSLKDILNQYLEAMKHHFVMLIMNLYSHFDHSFFYIKIKKTKI